MNRRVPGLALAAALMWPGATMEAAAQAEPPIEIAESGCTAARLGVSIDTDLIGEPVSGVSVAPPVWRAAAGRTPAHCSVDGAMAPIDSSETARPINFRVALPASWNRRAAQMGGGGFNGVIPNLTVDRFARFFVLPQTGHGLGGESYTVDGDGNAADPFRIPNEFDRFRALTVWVERGAGDGADRDGRRAQPADVLLSGVSALRRRSGRLRGFVSLQPALNRNPPYGSPKRPCRGRALP